MVEEFIVWLMLKLKDWGLLVMSVVLSSVALSMGLGWLTVFRRLIFSATTALVIANLCYHGFKLEFSISFACGYFLSFLLESAFRQRLDAMGRLIAQKFENLIQWLPTKKPGDE